MPTKGGFLGFPCGIIGLLLGLLTGKDEESDPLSQDLTGAKKKAEAGVTLLRPQNMFSA